MERKTKEQWLAEFKSIHGEAYDYSKSVIRRWCDKIIIICRNCGKEFSQTPNKHGGQQGHGCPHCKGERMSLSKRHSKEQFVKNVEERFGRGRFNLSEFNYVNNHTSGVVICNTCGCRFETTANTLLGAKYGCPSCAETALGRRLTPISKREFIERSKNKHGNKYDYSLVNYKSMYNKVEIVCKQCGKVFKQLPVNHLSGNGCPRCKNSGFLTYDFGSLYVFVDDLEIPTLMKVGVSVDPDKREKELKRRTPFPVFQVKTWYGTTERMFEVEQKLHKHFANRNCHFEGFDGCTEWFWYTPEVFDLLKNEIQD